MRVTPTSLLTKTKLSTFAELRFPGSFLRTWNSLESGKFNQPTNLEDHEQVWVVFDGIGGEGSVRLNGQDLGAIAMTRSTAEFDITRQLALHNELVVELAFRVNGDSDALGGLWGLVALEIRFDDDAASLPVTDRTAG